MLTRGKILIERRTPIIAIISQLQDTAAAEDLTSKVALQSKDCPTRDLELYFEETEISDRFE